MNFQEILNQVALDPKHEKTAAAYSHTATARKNLLTLTKENLADLVQEGERDKIALSLQLMEWRNEWTMAQNEATKWARDMRAEKDEAQALREELADLAKIYKRRTERDEERGSKRPF